MKRGFDEALSFETIEPSETHRFSAISCWEQENRNASHVHHSLVHNSMVITHGCQQTNMLDCDSTQRFQLAKPSAQLPFNLLHSLNCPVG